MVSSSGRSYHHGDLRRALLDAAVEEVAAGGAATISLRAVARRAGVSHAAPTHHFGDKAGVLSALAARGWRMLEETTGEALRKSGEIVDVGRAYVRFAQDQRPYFEVMFLPQLYRADDPEVAAARDAAGVVLFEVVARALGPDAPAETVWPAVVAAWSLSHGFATLWINGNFYPEVGSDPEQVYLSALAALAAMASQGAPKATHR